MLTPGERALIFRACWNHPVATCEQCGRTFKLQDLAADLRRRLSHLCPLCHIDLSHTAREHLISCGTVARLDAENLRAESRGLHEKSLALRKEAHRLRDAAGVVQAEAEAARLAKRSERQRRAERERPPQQK